MNNLINIENVSIPPQEYIAFIPFNIQRRYMKKNVSKKNVLARICPLARCIYAMQLSAER